MNTDVWSLKRYLVVPVLISALTACSDSAQQQAVDQRRDSEPANAEIENSATQNAGEYRTASPGAGVAEPVMPSDGPPPEQSPVPAVSDPNVPALPDQTLGQTDRSEPDTQKGPEPLDTVPVTGIVPGSPTMVTPNVDVSDETTASTVTGR